MCSSDLVLHFLVEHPGRHAQCAVTKDNDLLHTCLLYTSMKAEITACGEDALYNEIEFPLAQVLADMTRTGVLVDKDGIEPVSYTHLDVYKRQAILTGTG